MSSSGNIVIQRALFNQLAKIIFTLLAIIVVGLLLSIIWLVLGVIFSITIVGLPLGKKCFQISKYAFSPAKKQITYSDEYKVANLIWLPVGLVIFVVTFFLVALVSPFALLFPNIRKFYKLLKMSIKPFAVNIEKIK